MNHQPYENWLLDEKILTPAEKEQLGQHLAGCPQCARMEESLRMLDREFRAIPAVAPPAGFSTRWQGSLANRRRKQQREQTRIILISMAATSVAVGITAAGFLLPRVSPITFVANILTDVVKLVNAVSQFWLFVSSFLAAAPASLSIGITVTIILWTSLTLLAWGISLYRITLKGIRTTK